VGKGYIEKNAMCQVASKGEKQEKQKRQKAAASMKGGDQVITVINADSNGYKVLINS